MEIPKEFVLKCPIFNKSSLVSMESGKGLLLSGNKPYLIHCRQRSVMPYMVSLGHNENQPSFKLSVTMLKNFENTGKLQNDNE